MLKNYLMWIPAIMLMIIIFIFSSREGEESSENSSVITEAIVTGYEIIVNEPLEESKRIEVMDTLEFFVRKAAHMTEYALLAMAIAFPLFIKSTRIYPISSQYPFWGKHGLSWNLSLRSWVYTVCYAATDELHQRFVPGRTGKVTDILIDGGGAFLGLLCFLLMVSFMIKKRKIETASRS